MHFNFLSPQNKAPEAPVRNEDALTTFDTIALPLCSKRKAIEWNVNNRTPDTRAVYEQALLEIKEEMSLHGVTEEYYSTHSKTLLH